MPVHLPSHRKKGIRFVNLIPASSHYHISSLWASSKRTIFSPALCFILCLTRHRNTGRFHYQERVSDNNEQYNSTATLPHAVEYNDPPVTSRPGAGHVIGVLSCSDQRWKKHPHRQWTSCGLHAPTRNATSRKRKKCARAPRRSWPAS